MRPRNNKQREIMRLAQQLPPLTTAQAEWSRKAIFTHIAFATKQVAWCSDCGAIFAPIDNDNGE